jgi:hypothetical protein
MSVRLQDHQPDLLRRAAVAADRERLPPEVRVTVVVLLKQLFSECVPGAMEARPVDE